MWLHEPTCVTRAYMSDLIIKVKWMNKNRGVALLIWNTYSHLCSALMEEREVAGEGGGSVFDLPFGFTFYLLGNLY